MLARWLSTTVGTGLRWASRQLPVGGRAPVQGIRRGLVSQPRPPVRVLDPSSQSPVVAESTARSLGLCNDQHFAVVFEAHSQQYWMRRTPGSPRHTPAPSLRSGPLARRSLRRTKGRHSPPAFNVHESPQSSPPASSHPRAADQPAEARQPPWASDEARCYPGARRAESTQGEENRCLAADHSWSRSGTSPRP